MSTAVDENVQMRLNSYSALIHDENQDMLQYTSLLGDFIATCLWNYLPVVAKTTIYSHNDQFQPLSVDRMYELYDNNLIFDALNVLCQFD